jgi:hypothetical protein
MPDQHKRFRIETEAIVVGYAMSRLDRGYLDARNCSSWEQAFAEAANALSKPPRTFDNLRDEFDPVHPNPRRGWHQRQLRPNRQRVLDELKDLSDDALNELVARILQRDENAIAEAIDSLAVVNHIAHNVAERLLTGHRAEEYFLANSEPLIKVVGSDILDMRQMACGYDFGVQHKPEWAIEIKGLKATKGGILFTDREWSEAKARRENYWLVVVGNLSAQPAPCIIRDPHTVLPASSKYRQSLTVEWHAQISVLS